MTTPDEVPDWLVEGASVTHGTFGTGTVGRVGDYKGEPTIWVDFDYGERKALSLEHALPHLTTRKRWTRRTAPRPELRCDVCGARPLVVNTHNQKLCESHKSRFRA